MSANITVITETENGFDVTVTCANGFTESIEGLYDVDEAIRYSHMHLAYQNNRRR